MYIDNFRSKNALPVLPEEKGCGPVKLITYTLNSFFFI